MVDEKTILAHEQLVVKIASQYHTHAHTEMDDLIQQGWLGLLKAAAKWDSTKGVTFGAYARLWIKGSVYRYVFARRPQWEGVMDTLLVDVTSTQSELTLDLLADALEVLPPEHAAVMRHRLVDHLSLTATARLTGRTAGDALALYEQGIEMLRIFTE